MTLVNVSGIEDSGMMAGLSPHSQSQTQLTWLMCQPLGVMTEACLTCGIA